MVHENSRKSLPHEWIRLLPVHPRARLPAGRLRQEVSARTHAQADVHWVEVVAIALLPVVLLHSGVGIGSAWWRPEEILLELVVLLLAVGVVVQHSHPSAAVVRLSPVVGLSAVSALWGEVIGSTVAEAVIEGVSVPFALSLWISIEILLCAGVPSSLWRLRLREG
jgi:hypothetical protein